MNAELIQMTIKALYEADKRLMQTPLDSIEGKGAAAANCLMCAQLLEHYARMNNLLEAAAPYVFKLPPVGNYIMPPNAKYDAECDRADRLNDSIKLGETA
mgnify:FL=1